MIYLPHQVCEWRGVACDKLAWVALLGVTGAARPITHEHNAASPMAGSRAAVNHREDGVHPTPYRSLRRHTHLDTTLYIPPSNPPLYPWSPPPAMSGKGLPGTKMVAPSTVSSAQSCCHDRPFPGCLVWLGGVHPLSLRLITKLPVLGYCATLRYVP